MRAAISPGGMLGVMLLAGGLSAVAAAQPEPVWERDLAAAVSDYYAQLVKITDGANSNRSSLAEARNYAADQ